MVPFVPYESGEESGLIEVYHRKIRSGGTELVRLSQAGGLEGLPSSLPRAHSDLVLGAAKAGGAEVILLGERGVALGADTFDRHGEPPWD